MAMMVCPQCKAPVSTLAKTCPSCGAPVPASSSSRLIWGVLGLIAIIYLVSQWGSLPFPAP